MSVIFILVIIGVIVAGLFLAGFIWAVKSGQYDDTYTPSVRMLFDEQTQNQTDVATGSQSSTATEANLSEKEVQLNKPKL